MKTHVIAALLLALCPIVRGEAPAAQSRKPADCITLPLRFGLKPTDGGNPKWIPYQTGWASTCRIEIPAASGANAGKGTPNRVTCLLMGSKTQVRNIHIEADIFHMKHEKETLAKFHELAIGLMSDFGLKDAKQTDLNIAQEQTKAIEVNGHPVTIVRTPFKKSGTGYSLRFDLTMKK